METRNLKNWEELEKGLGELFKLHAGMQKKTERRVVSNLLFRGQSDSEWKLKTTLERNSDESMNLLEYYSIILAVKSEIETFTGRSWIIPSATEFSAILARQFGLGGFHRKDVHEYMAYLRHNGFPSPLLDWTTSPYIAAYFAFRGADPQKEGEEPSVAIYAFIEYPGGIKRGLVAEPFIFSLGPTIKVHPRHFLQKCQYTMCCVKKGDGQKIYSSHEDVFARDERGQDLLWKFIIPVTQRTEVLKRLEISNINSYSLFGSEESLIETIAIRKFTIKE